MFIKAIIYENFLLNYLSCPKKKKKIMNKWIKLILNQILTLLINFFVVSKLCRFKKPVMRKTLRAKFYGSLIR